MSANWRHKRTLGQIISGAEHQVGPETAIVNVGRKMRRWRKGREGFLLKRMWDINVSRVSLRSHVNFDTCAIWMSGIRHMTNETCADSGVLRLEYRRIFLYFKIPRKIARYF